MKLYVEVTTVTDTCFAGGHIEGTGDVDTATETDAEGFPIIRGRTLKGLLVEEAALIVLETNNEIKKAASILFGDPQWHLSKALLSFADGSVVPAVREAFKSNKWETGALTTVRRQTAIDHATGAAKTGSLRSSRLVRKGVRLRCMVTAPRELTTKERGLLAGCVVAVRRAGLHRNEGWGRVRCRLLDEAGTDCTARWLPDLLATGETEAPHAIKPPVRHGGDSPERSVVEFDVVLDRPALIADRSAGDWVTTSLPYLPGSTFIGACAARWGANASRMDLASDPGFHRLFLGGSVRWLNAYPCDVGARAIHAPRSWRERPDSPGSILDLATEEGRESDRENPGKPLPPGAFFVPGQERIRIVKVPTVARFHHERDRELGRSKEGEIFVYDALAPGQSFCGAVLCDDAGDAAMVKELLAGATLQLGRSRTATYGAAARVTSVRVLPAEGWQEAPGQKSPDALLLTSDYLGRNQKGTADPTALLAELCERLGLPAGALDEQPSYLAHRVVHGRVGRWHLPRPAHVAVAAGSLIVLPKVSQQKLADLMWKGIGERRAEGFGRVCSVSLDDAELPAEHTTAHTSVAEELLALPRDQEALPEIRRWVAVVKLREALLDDGVALGARLRRVSPSLIARLRQEVRAASSLAEVRAFVRGLAGKKAGRELARVSGGKSFDEIVLAPGEGWKTRFAHVVPTGIDIDELEPLAWQLQQHWLDAVLERWRRAAQKEGA